jgi:hypothetical protein
MPISAEAKRLIVDWGFSITYARAVATSTVYGASVALLLPIGMIALALLIRSAPTERVAARCAGGLAIVYLFIFFGINALSGWIFFGWYAFPFAPATVAALTFVWLRWASLLNKPMQVALTLVCLAIGPVLGARYFIQHGPGWSMGDNGLAAMSVQLAQETRGLDGLFAMGAIAGFATYMMDKPVFQAEGLVADRDLVNHIRHEDSLGDVLKEYQVDYLIVSAFVGSIKPSNGCYALTQPSVEWAGTRTAKMRGEICAEPIRHFVTKGGGHSYSVFPELETFVWDLQNASWR